MHKLVDGVKVELTKEEHEAVVAEWAAYDRDFAKNKYKQDREARYPPIGDQLDAIWKWIGAQPNLSGPAQAMALEIQNVKELFPKPKEG